MVAENPIWAEGFSVTTAYRTADGTRFPGGVRPVVWLRFELYRIATS